MRGRAGRYTAAALGALVLAMGAIASATAQTATATTLFVKQGGSDSAPCTSTSPCATVSHALTIAASGAIIEVSGIIDDHLTITSPVTITNWPGGPAGSSGVLDGTASGSWVVEVGGGVTGVTLGDLTIQHGGQVGINNFGTLKLTDSTVSGNPQGITNNGNGIMTVIDSTISGNTGAVFGAGISNAGAMTVIASTISGNNGGTGGIGGIATGAGTVHLGATIVAGNTPGNCHAAAAGQIASDGYNLTDDPNGTACSFNAVSDRVGKNPLLGPLANNGGTTQTMLPNTKSPAANVIPKTTTLSGFTVCPGKDQRGFARPGHGETGCTIGAAEAALNIATTTKVTVMPTTVTAGTRVVYLAVVTPTGASQTGTIAFTTGSTTLCTATLSGGVAACGATNAPTGTDTVTAKYSGGGGFASSSGTATLTVT